MGAVVPASLGAAGVLLISVVGAFSWNDPENLAEMSDPDGTAHLVQTLCYLPMLAWGPLLLVVTVAYHRRRRGEAGTTARDASGRW